MFTKAFAKLKPLDVVPAKGSRKLAVGSTTRVPPPRTTKPVMDILVVSRLKIVRQDSSQHQCQNLDDPDAIRGQDGHTIVQDDDCCETRRDCRTHRQWPEYNIRQPLP
jgi:hypothetical protein